MTEIGNNGNNGDDTKRQCHRKKITAQGLRSAGIGIVHHHG